jgi:hypothetical protein
MQDLLYAYHLPTKGKQKYGGLLLYGKRHEDEPEQTTLLPIGVMDANVMEFIHLNVHPCT